ncbi:MAG TPA: arylesterase [Thermoanaerobaculia bacterium]|nr:arylesterase [Thermoanaerobaculia bacterium]
MRSNVRNLALTLLIPVAWGCGPGASSSPSGEARSAPPPAAPAATRPAPAGEGRPLVVFLGDSLTAGLGLDEAQAYPALVAQELQEQDRPIRVLNAGVSGDTTAGGLSRLDWLLKQKPDILVVGLGANDALRGQSVAQIEKNLREIVRRSKEAGARVLLLGMQIPPNYGGDYARDYAALYPRIADEMDVALVPFLLEGVGGVPELNLEDGIHPNAEGQERVAENVAPRLADLLREEKVASE